NLAIMFANQGKTADAQFIYHQLEVELPALTPRLPPPQAARARQVLAYVINGLSKLQLAAGARQEGLAGYRPAAPLHRDLAREHPEEPNHVNNQARDMANAAAIMLMLNQPNEAQKELLEALDMLRALVKKYPDEPDYVAGEGKALVSLGVEALRRLQVPKGIDW